MAKEIKNKKTIFYIIFISIILVLSFLALEKKEMKEELISDNSIVTKQTNEYWPGGVRIRITGPNGYNEEFVTEEGKSKIFELKEAGKYKIEELSAPVGFVISEPVEFEVKESDLSSNTNEATRIVKKLINSYTKLQISNRDLTTGIELAGSKLEIYNSKGELVKSYTTSNKPYIMKMIEPGKYTIKQTSTARGYMLNKKEIKFSVQNTGKMQYVTINNSRYIDVPITDAEKTKTMYIVGIVLLLGGAGIFTYFYLKKKKEEKVEKLS